jgi:hypothetical protein
LRLRGDKLRVVASRKDPRELERLEPKEERVAAAPSRWLYRYNTIVNIKSQAQRL